MSEPRPLEDLKKLTVIYRVEPGCLGPKGAERIEPFCQFAQDQMRNVDANYINWKIIPRFDKSLPEMSYQVLGKSMSHQQAVKYLSHFNKSLDELEGHLSDKLAEMISGF